MSLVQPLLVFCAHADVTENAMSSIAAQTALVNSAASPSISRTEGVTTTERKKSDLVLIIGWFRLSPYELPVGLFVYIIITHVLIIKNCSCFKFARLLTPRKTLSPSPAGRGERVHPGRPRENPPTLTDLPQAWQNTPSLRGSAVVAELIALTNHRIRHPPCEILEQG